MCGLVAGFRYAGAYMAGYGWIYGWVLVVMRVDMAAVAVGFGLCVLWWVLAAPEAKRARAGFHRPPPVTRRVGAYVLSKLNPVARRKVNPPE